MASNSTSAELLAGESMMYHNFTLTVATFFFGGYSVLILLSTRMMLKRGLKTRSLRVLFFVGLFMYIISATFWTYSLVYVVGIVQAYIDPQNDQWMRFATQTSHLVTFFNAIVLVNFVLSDGIVCWRSWVISRRDYPKLIVLPVAFWAFTICENPNAIPQRLHHPHLSVNHRTHYYANLGPPQQAMRDSKPLAWRHRRVMKDNFYNLQGHKLKQSRATQAMVLLIESGVLYCLTGVLGTASQLIHLPFGTLNDIILSANIQFAGAYAPALLLLISNHQSEDSDIEYLGTLPISMPSGTLAAPQTRTASQQRSRLAQPSTLQFAVSVSVSRSVSVGMDSTQSSPTRDQWGVEGVKGANEGFEAELEKNRITV
ncbi:hypothetical protein FB45DRAFT_1007369 [Roridomyces roridus]|uniref:Uncharacterized protein n=1 Tax=Roridomyces roridus TaxID=1738132 RepID=A0AAD7BEA0_9AGAR|nr:hypothetical protein FB45DRAFT_1007369 [Roridomyces roridus]